MMLPSRETHPATRPSQSTEEPDFSEHAVDRIDNGRVGLGNRVVKRSLVRAMRHDDERLSQNDNYKVISAVSDTMNNHLLDMTDKQKKQFNAFLSRHEQSVALDQLLGFEPGGRKKDYVGKLLEADENGVSTLTDDQIVNFFEWHNYELQKRQTEADKIAERQKKRFTERFEWAQQKGWIPSWVTWVDERMEQTRLAIDDGFDTDYAPGQRTASAANAMHRPAGHHEVVLSPHSLKKAEKYLTHEFIHVTDGYETGAIDNMTNVQGLYKLFDRRSYAGLVLNEAVVEHLADSMYKRNNIDRINPYSLQRYDAVYEQERKLLYVLTTMGEKHIDIRAFIAAHFDDGKQFDDEGVSPTAALMNQLRDAFPGLDILRNMRRMRNQKDLTELIESLQRQAPGGHTIVAEKIDKSPYRFHDKAAAAAIGAVGVAAAGILTLVPSYVFSEDDSPRQATFSPRGDVAADVAAVQPRAGSNDPAIYTAPDPSNLVPVATPYPLPDPLPKNYS